MDQPVILTDFPLRTTDKVRYADTDRQGHVNNALFATFLETGRVAVLYDPGLPLAEPGSAFVIARLELDFRSEITWPGEIAIGTRVESIGRSSIELRQALFQNDRCAALARTVIVLMDEATRRSRPLSTAAVTRLSAFGPGPAADV
ncbi:acyl-CoA thioesterase [Methylobacterium sp. SyP6R]|uniref:acyl-CoA thioesterase n=1 Tax=Methylobacterium sp. SyP6R TaxID=2718876 RepID=UPI001F3971B4|nr:thioesterase family protein [Methylobacterium sp. SyP6R]MCF4129997.1 acyl-CoA thioesterase [Methylobacterium sp. SyP6R]